MQPQVLINFFKDYSRFLDSLPRNGHNQQFYIIIKSVIFEVYHFYRHEWSDTPISEIRNLQTAYEHVVWQAHVKYGLFNTEQYYERPRLPPPQ